MSRGSYHNGSPAKEGFLLHKDFPLMVSIPEAMARVFESPQTQESLIEDSSLHIQVRTDTGSAPILCLSRAGVDRKMTALHKALVECNDREEVKEVSLFVPADMVAVIIGKRGRQIAKYQEQSRASISVEDRPVPHMSERIIKVGGSLRCVEAAVEMIHSSVVEHRCYDRERQTVFTVQVRSEDLRSCSDWLQSRPEVRVHEETVTIQGPVRDCVYIACRLFEMIDEQTPRADNVFQLKLSHRSPHMVQKLRLLRKSLTDIELVYTTEGSDQVKLVLKGGLRARLSALREVVEELEQRSRSSSRDSRKRSRSRSRSVSPCILNILVPQGYVGRLIGRGGCNVKVLKEQSGCQINFQPHSLKTLRTASNQEARVCTLSGTAAAVAAGARVVLQQVLKFEAGS